MAITVSNVDVGAVSSPSSPRSLGSVAFQNNRLYVVTFSMRGGTTPDVTALSGGGITWTKTTASRGTTPFMAQYSGLATSGASTAALSATFTSTPTSFKWTTEEFAGVDTTTPIQQTVAFTGSNNVDGSVTFSAFGDAVNNVAYAVYCEGLVNESSVTVDPSGGWAQLTMEGTALTSAQTLFSQYKIGQDLTATCDFPGSAANNVSENGLEIKAGAAVVTRKLQVVIAPRRW